MAKAGVARCSAITSCPRTSGAPICGRGARRALVTAFDADHVAQGNALAGYKLAPDRPLLGPIDADRMWDNYRVFLEAVLPVAEEVGVRWRSIPTTRRSPTGLVGSPASCPVPKDSSERGSYQAAARRGASTYASGPYPRWPVEIASNGSSTRSGRPADLHPLPGRAGRGAAVRRNVPRRRELRPALRAPTPAWRGLRRVHHRRPRPGHDRRRGHLGGHRLRQPTPAAAGPTPSATSRACSPRSTPRTAHDR